MKLSLLDQPLSMAIAWIICLIWSLSNVSAIPYPSASGSGNRPRLKLFHFDANIVEGQLVRIFCQLSDGAQTQSFQWLKDGQPLLSTASQHIDIQTFRDYSSLVIDRVERTRDSGNYTCLVSNSFGSDQHSSMLIVQEPPIFVEQPHDISIGLHQSTTLVCRATSSHTSPVIKWNRILSTLPLDKDARRKHIWSGEKFHLNDVRFENAGVYECVAENPHNGLAISHTFTVTINVPAYFETKTDQLEVKRGETAKLICETFGARPVSILWLRQNARTGEFEPLDLDYISESYTFPRYATFEKNFDSFFGPNNTGPSTSVSKHLPFVNNNRTLFELHINTVNSFDNGQYACRSRNEFGEDTRRINLFVQDVPAAVRQVHVDQIWSRDVSISWLSPETIGNSPIIQYVIQYWKVVNSDNRSSTGSGGGGVSSGYRLHEMQISPTETQATIKGLIPGTSYVVRVIAVNGFGRGPSSSVVNFTTVEEAPNSSPIDIIVEPQGTSVLRIRWKAPPKSHWNGQLRGYYLGYRLLESDSGEDRSSGEAASKRYAYKEVPFEGTPANNFQEEYQLSGLMRASLYSIIIRAFNGVGDGPNSQEIVIATAANDPPPKPIVQIMEAKEEYIVLKWDIKSSFEITHFMIFYKEETKPGWLEMEVSKSDSEMNVYKLTGLRKATVYQVFMRAIGDNSAMSEPSDVITVRTDGEFPLVNMLNSNINVEPQQPYHVAPIPTVYGATAMQPTLATFQQQVPPYLRLSFIVPIVIAVVIITVACVGAYVYIRVDDRKAKMKAFRSASNVYSGTLALGPGKRFQYMSAGSGPSTSFNSCNQSIVSEEGSLSFRYSDSGSDKSRPLLSRPPLPTGVLWAQQQSPIPEEDEAIVEIGSSAYETLPFQKNFHQSTPVQNFNGMNQTNGSNHSNNSGKSPSNAKSPPFPPPPPPLPSVFGINKSSPLNQNKLNGNNIFCHADVHHVQSSGASDANNSDSYDDFHFFAPAPQHV